MGAIASGGVRVLNPEVIRMTGVTDDMIEHVTREESRELADVSKPIAPAVPWWRSRGAW
jgi:predicted phosphoribosyltransferase